MDDVLIADIITLLVAMVFGPVHCLAWSSEFQSHLEEQLWRYSAIIIIIIITLVLFFWGAAIIAALGDLA